MKTLMLTLVACAALALAACGDDDSSNESATGSPNADNSAPAPLETSGDASTRSKPKVVLPRGAAPEKLEKIDLIEGTGPEAKTGDEVTVHYVGVGLESGKEFDASWDRNEPFTFPLGGGEVIAGWDQGIVGMKVGGQRQLIIPAELAYGEEGRPPTIKPNEPLVFVIDLLAVS
jgi:peptidylprolyl isomerase